MNKIEEQVLDKLLNDEPLSEEEQDFLKHDQELSEWVNNIEASLQHAEYFLDDGDENIHQILVQEEKQAIKRKQLKSTIGFILVAASMLIGIATFGIQYGFDLVIAGQVFITMLVPWIIVFFALKERRRAHVE